MISSLREAKAITPFSPSATGWESFSSVSRLPPRCTMYSRLAKGNFDYRIHLPDAAWEYRQVGDIFNMMAGQIKDLKIQVYEEQLHRQESELNFLYMQMRPHFFLNALTTLKNFVKLGQYENMYDFTGYLGRYIRYSLRRHVSNVTLGDEMDHIENYVAM